MLHANILKKQVPMRNLSNFGGEIGIRTPGPFQVNGFQDRRFRPLSHLSIYLNALFLSAMFILYTFNKTFSTVFAKFFKLFFKVLSTAVFVNNV